MNSLHGKNTKPKHQQLSTTQTKTKQNSLAGVHVAAEFFTSLFSGHRHQQQNREHFNATEAEGIFRGNRATNGGIYKHIHICMGVYLGKYMHTNGWQQWPNIV